MYSVLKYLVQNAINYQGSNSKLSGGFPHSEIPGSKLILSSPGLIAEYHVLHRLFLDQIKREKGVWWMPWQQEAMKDVILCDKLGGAENRF